MNRKRNIPRILLALLLTVAATLSASSARNGKTVGEKEGTMREVARAVFCPVSEGEEDRALAASVLNAPCDLDTGDIVGALSEAELDGLLLYPGGMPFGVKFLTEGVTVVGFCDVDADGKRVNPANDAGLKLKDVIMSVNGEPLSGASQLTQKIETCNGSELVLLCLRGKEQVEIRLTPVYCQAEKRYKTGIWVRDSGAGIGTVTFIVPETGAFAGLGHGICDADTGELIAMKRGTVMDVTISSVVRGAVGKPGELKGYFNPGKTGSLLGNTSCGVWGVLSEIPTCHSDPIPIGRRDEIQEGSAYILSTLDSNKIGEYDVQISNIKNEANGSKCFTVKITDPDLLAISGGIVQGMSGSPIIQNGKLVGAVTHVLVNDPTTGYGIFVENMLVNMPIPAR